LANPYLVFNEILGSSWLAALVTTLPTFFLAVLFTYFGDTMGKQRWADLKAVAHYLSQCLARDPANPAIFLQATVFRLYPAATFVCMTINVFMAIFSAAAAMEMMRFAFENSVSPGAMLALYVLAQIGISIIGISAPLDYQKMLLTYYALYLDQGPRHDIMMFHEGVEALQSDLFRLKPAPDVHPAEAAEENAESKSASITTWCSSWHGGSQEDSSASQRLLEACV